MNWPNPVTRETRQQQRRRSHRRVWISRILETMPHVPRLRAVYRQVATLTMYGCCNRSCSTEMMLKRTLSNQKPHGVRTSAL